MYVAQRIANEEHIRSRFQLSEELVIALDNGSVLVERVNQRRAETRNDALKGCSDHEVCKRGRKADLRIEVDKIADGVNICQYGTEMLDQNSVNEIADTAGEDKNRHLCGFGKAKEVGAAVSGTKPLMRRRHGVTSEAYLSSKLEFLAYSAKALRRKPSSMNKSWDAFHLRSGTCVERVPGAEPRWPLTSRPYEASFLPQS